MWLMSLFLQLVAMIQDRVKRNYIHTFLTLSTNSFLLHINKFFNSLYKASLKYIFHLKQCDIFQTLVIKC